MKQKTFLMIALLCVVAQGAWADEWDGNAEVKPSFTPNYNGYKNVVIIESAAQLYYINKYWDSASGYNGNKKWNELNYYLNTDIDMGTSVSWIPLGRRTTTVTQYEGTFYGNGHTVKFRTDYEKSTTKENQGFFSTIDRDAKVYDLNVDCWINSDDDYVGGICGENYGLIQNCTVNGYLKSKDPYVGGISGKGNSSSKILDCHVNATIKGENDNIGGIVGYSLGIIENCTVTGKVEGTDNSQYVGGITGYDSGSSTVWIRNCSVSADVSASWHNAGSMFHASVGGLVGSQNGTVEYCCMSGNVSGEDAGVGGLAGDIDGEAHIKHCTFYGNVTSSHSQKNIYIGNYRSIAGANEEELHGKDNEFASDDALNTYLAKVDEKYAIYRNAVQNPYTITVSNSGYGLIEAGVERTRSGKTVTLTKLYGTVESITVKDAGDNTITVNGNEASGWTFTMPNRNVNITAVFAAMNWDDANMGTAENPYFIGRESEWNEFADRVNNGNSFSGKHVKLMANIEVTKKCGVVLSTNVPTHAFSGTFDGNDKTITANISYVGDQGTALFSYINGATIKNLNVAGEITGIEHAAALVGFSSGSNNVIQNCKVSANVNGGSHVGGILGHGLASDITISGCVYSGKIMGGGTAKGIFFGWGNAGGTKNVTDCLYLEDTYQILSHLDLVWMYAGSVNVTNCYKTSKEGTYGCQVSTTIPAGEIYKPVTAADGNTYYMLCSVSGVKDKYNHTGNVISIVPTITAKDGTVLSTATDYTYTTSPATVQAMGDYTLTINGNGNYQGTKVFQFVVKQLYNIDSNSDALENGEYNLLSNVTIDKRITITGDVVLNLGEGATLTAHKGIELSQGNSLTINGPGALTIDNCSEQKSGIGAERVGTLTINGGTINVTGGYQAAAIGGDWCNHTNGGNITINGGVVNATGGTYGAGIGGGFQFYSSTGICGTIIINGGQVTATGGTDAPGIGPGAINGGSDSNSGALTLGWTNPTDFIRINGLKNNANMTLSNISFADGRAFVLEGTTTIATTSNISGNKITPYYLTLTGEGTAENPYTINSTEEWDYAFVYNVNSGNNYSGKVVKLAADININYSCGTVSGSPENAFSGTFLGDGHTLTANISNNNYQGTAPFRYINNATIKNLNIAGTIASNRYHTSGLVGFADGTNLIEGCNITATINQSNDYAGGIVGHGRNSTTTIKSSIFSGTINGTNGNRNNIGGIWGWSNTSTPVLVDCMEKGTYNNISSMHPIGLQSAAGTITNCYYLTPQIGSPSNACTVNGAYRIYTTVPDGELYDKQPLVDGNKYYLLCTVNDVDDVYGKNESIMPAVMASNGAVLNFGIDFAVALDAENVTQLPHTLTTPGEHTLTITALGDNCGSKTFNIIVVSHNLADGDTYTQTTDVAVESATYTKSLDESRVGKHQPWLVPFDYTIKEADTKKFTFYKINMIANAPNPETNATDQMWVFLKQLDKNDVLHANMPYVYKPKQAVDNYAFTTTNAVLKAKNTGVIAKTETMEDIYYFYATYEPTTATTANPFYYVNINGSVSYGDAVTLGAFRWIIRKVSKFGDTPSYAPEMHFFDGEGTTDIIAVKEVNGVSEVNDNSWFTLDGRKLTGKPTKAGIYVTNGKKVVVK